LRAARQPRSQGDIISTLIGRIEAFPLRYSDPNDAGKQRYVTLARIETDGGVVGWGEAVTMPPETSLACKVLIEQGFAPLLAGRDATRVRNHWQTMREHGFWAGIGGVMTLAASAVDTALWDVAGKVAGQPVHALLGGKVHDSLPACSSVIWDTEDIERTAAQFARLSAEGYRTLKGGWGLNKAAAFGLDERRDVALVRAVREAIGEERAFVADVAEHARWDATRAIAMTHKLAAAGLTWIEDPLPIQDRAGLRRLRASSALPIATGEREWTVESYRELVRTGAVDLILIDPGRAEGLTGMKLASDHAAGHGVRVVPHSWSSAVNTAAALHVLATCPNAGAFELKELPTAVTHDLVARPFAHREGRVEIPDEPGLGITVDEDVVRELAYRG
jgi:L-alanine-DL-glutamate epimerase-like enolase superfamily enzyme